MIDEVLHSLPHNSKLDYANLARYTNKSMIVQEKKSNLSCAKSCQNQSGFIKNLSLLFFLQYQSYEDENLAMVKNAFHIAPSIFRSLESLDVLTFDIEF